MSVNVNVEVIKNFLLGERVLKRLGLFLFSRDAEAEGGFRILVGTLEGRPHKL
jgi:hypothetical protein